MANELSILYQPTDYDNLIDYLKQLFGDNVAGVEVDDVLPKQFLRLSWAEGQQDYAVATELTEAFPNIIIETPSTTDMDVSSRFFNGSQLW